MQCRSFDMGVEKNNLGNSEYQTLKFNYRQFRRDSHVSDTSSFPTEEGGGWSMAGPWPVSPRLLSVSSPCLTRLSSPLTPALEFI